MKHCILCKVTDKFKAKLKEVSYLINSNKLVKSIHYPKHISGSAF